MIPALFPIIPISVVILIAATTVASPYVGGVGILIGCIILASCYVAARNETNEGKAANLLREALGIKTLWQTLGASYNNLFSEKERRNPDSAENQRRP